MLNRSEGSEEAHFSQEIVGGPSSWAILKSCYTYQKMSFDWISPLNTTESSLAVLYGIKHSTFTPSAKIDPHPPPHNSNVYSIYDV